MIARESKPPAERPSARPPDSIDRLNPPLSRRGAALLRLLRRGLEDVIAAHLEKGADRVLVDYGCGGMPYRPLFQPHVARYVGVDLPDNPQADVHLTADGTVPLPDNFADVVLSSQVLEHTVNPFGYLAECRRILKVGGLLILSTHGLYPYHPDPQDLWRWTGTGLKNLVQAWGFGVVSLEGVMGLAPTGLQLLQEGLGRKLPTPLRSAAAALCQPLALALDRIHTPADRRKDACVFVVVARNTSLG